MGGEKPLFFLIRTDGKNYELVRACNNVSEVILFSQIFDLEHPPGSGYDLIITKRESSRVETYFNKRIKKVRQREWLRTDSIEKPKQYGLVDDYQAIISTCFDHPLPLPKRDSCCLEKGNSEA